MSKRSVIVLVILAFLFGAFVWPTLYRYEHGAAISGDGSQLIRINRFTGNGQLFYGGEWID